MKNDVLYFQIANFNFKINFDKTEWGFIKIKLRDEIQAYLKDFLIMRKPKKLDYIINLTWQEIPRLHQLKNRESYLSLFVRKGRKIIVCYYRMGIVEFEYILLKIVTELLSKSNGFTLHASALNINGEANIFLGKSGAGKSTIIELLKAKYPPLADDSLIIRTNNNKFCLYQTPFFEKAYWIKTRRQKYNISRVFLLRKKRYCKLKKITNKELVTKEILAHLKVGRALINKQAHSVFQFVSEFNNFYYLEFTKSREELTKII